MRPGESGGGYHECGTDLFRSYHVLIVLMSLLAGCEIPDRRLVEDQRSCEIMGHVRGTPFFSSAWLI